MEQKKSRDREPTNVTLPEALALLNERDRGNDTKLAQVYSLIGALANRVEVLERERFAQQDLEEEIP